MQLTLLAHTRPFKIVEENDISITSVYLLVWCPEPFTLRWPMELTQIAVLGNAGINDEELTIFTQAENFLIQDH